MRAISLHQPYASAVALGLKRNETRHWSTNYRGPLAIHAAARNDRQTRRVFEDIVTTCHRATYELLDAACECDFDRLPFGAYVCTCVLVDCVRVEDLRRVRALTATERLFGNYAPGRFVWLLDNIKQLPEPIPAKGRQGFWTWEK
jgi:hypothetical protein